MSRRKFAKVAIIAVGGTIVAASVPGFDTFSYFNRYKNARELSREFYDCIIIHGYATSPNGELPIIGEKRIDAGIELYFNKKAGRILFTEGKSANSVSGAKVMANYALNKGVPSSAIVLEENAMSTLQNAYYTKVNHLVPNKWKQNIVVTSGNHMPRVKYAFDRFLGLEFVTYPYSELSGLYDEGEKEISYLYGYNAISVGVPDGDHEALKGRFQFFNLF